FTAEAWSLLPAPDQPTLDWLAVRIPGVKAARVREMTADGIEATLAEAVARGQSPTDLFSDAGLRDERLLLVRGEALSGAFERYEIPVITLAAGRTTSGQDYRMDALLLGDGRVEMLYDKADFRIKNPYFNDYDYTLAARVSYGILGAGDMSVSGVTVEAGLVRPKITRFTKLGSDRIRVETSWGSREKPLLPIRRR
ncbi:MAG: hypothetical protein HY553_10785, partial [Elusimicrobia bacterium]|nr:hypothetical protein [Elusimicrobiota bacterium]